MMNSAGSITASINYIEANLNEKLGLDSVANATHYSKYHLHRMFTNTAGLTIHDYIQRRQLTEAARMLVYTKKPVIEVALLSGYQSQQAFTAAFRAMYKQSPSRFRQRKQFYPLLLRFKLQADSKSPSIHPINCAEKDDLPLWMDLVHFVVDGFPCFIENEYIDALNLYIAEKRAFIMKEPSLALGVMLLSKDKKTIDFLGVHPQWRKKGIAKAFLNKAIHDFPGNSEICITTFRRGDAAENGSRQVLKRLGFLERECLTELGYPTQKFVLPVDSWTKAPAKKPQTQKGCIHGISNNRTRSF